jgi:hypothetical protein
MVKKIRKESHAYKHVYRLAFTHSTGRYNRYNRKQVVPIRTP